jgi:transcriptional regulator with XRE-family HTH domain
MPGRGRANGIHPVDRRVGFRIRAQRRLRGVSQAALAKQLGITFQQVQKYERGANRVSASTLYDIATALSLPVSDFFAGLPMAAEDDALRRRLERLFETADGERMADLFPRIAEARHRRAIVNLVRAVVEGDTV